jgi:hypothetical protein
VKSSEQINEIASALAAFQGEIGTVAKDANNPFFRSRYASFAACRRAAGPALAKNGLAVVQSSLTDLEKNEIGVRTLLLHKSGQYFENECWAKQAKMKDGADAQCTPQNIGAVSSYLRRTEYCAIIGLVADDDDDGEETSGRPVPTYNPNAPGHREDLLAAMKRVKIEDLNDRKRAAMWVEVEKVAMNELDAALRHWIKEVKPKDTP